MVGVLGVCAAVPLAVAHEELGSGGFVVAALAILALAILGFLYAREKRVEEEAEEPARLRTVADRPLEALAGSIEETTEPLRRWAFWLGVLALIAVPLSLMGSASDAPRDSLVIILSGLTWLLMAVAAWRVATTASRAWSILLLLIPAADLIAIFQQQDSLRDGNPFVPLVFFGLGARCCWLTFRYHHQLRLGA